MPRDPASLALAIVTWVTVGFVVLTERYLELPALGLALGAAWYIAWPREQSP